MQTTFNAVVFNQTHHRTPARFRGGDLFADLVVIAFNLTQAFLQIIHFRFTEHDLFFELIATRTVVTQRGMQLITTDTCTLFRIRIGLNPDIL